MVVLKVLGIILVILVIALVALYFWGRKLEKNQAESKALMEANKQVVNMLVIDKKKLKVKESGLPQAVIDQTPKYMRWAKLPVVKAKIGPKIMILIADAAVFEHLPLKTECRCVVSGIYITEIKSVRGGKIENPVKKKNVFQKLIGKFQKKK